MVNSCVHQMSGATGSTKCWSVEVEQLLEGLCVISIRRSVKDFMRDWCERLQTHSLDFCVLWQLTINKIILILIFTFFYVLTLNQTLVESILHVYLKTIAWFINRFYIGGQHFWPKTKKQKLQQFFSVAFVHFSDQKLNSQNELFLILLNKLELLWNIQAIDYVHLSVFLHYQLLMWCCSKYIIALCAIVSPQNI